MKNTNGVAVIVRKYFSAYEAKDRKVVEELLSDDFTFSSPLDEHISRTEYFKRCWPNSEKINSFQIEKCYEKDNEVFVRYECRQKTGAKFRSVELFKFEGNKIKEIDVYFGREMATEKSKAAEEDQIRGLLDVASHLPREVIRHAVRALSPNECGQLFEYIQGFAGFDFNFALELLEIAAPILATAIGHNSIQTFRGVHDLSHWVLGEGLFLDMKPTKRQRAISRRIIEGLNPAEVVKGIITCRFGEWENYARLLALVSRVHPAKRRAIVQAMDWKALDTIVSNHLEKPGHEFSLLLNSMVTDNKTGEPVASWLLKHALEIREVGSLIVLMSPQTALTVLTNGGKINLAMGHASWFRDAVAIARIGKLDETAGKKVIENNIEHIAKGVAELSLCHGMSELLGLIAEVSDLLEKLLNAVDVSRANERWPAALVDHRPEERKAARSALTFVSKHHNGHLGKLARRLIRQVRFRKRPITQTEK
jgi:ketosteroid isomerase-like protein